MTVFVKICGITDEAAVRAAVDAGADAIGFVFHDRSPRNLSIADAVRLGDFVPADIKKIAVTMHPDASLWEDIQALFNPDALQTDLEDFAYLSVDPDVEKWPVLREGSVPKDLPEFFVYEGKKSGHGETVDWVIAAGYSRQGRMILAGGLNAANVGEAIDKVAPFGVDVSSAVESRPGVKDPDRIRAFIEAAKAA
ncbi:MAG: phosphoribosylanthranilate isomerase [Gammaproteobacteria bacterium]|nr:phosphoribosylanthranilate isomerase [Gammaproteobacteria bacterium]